MNAETHDDVQPTSTPMLRPLLLSVFAPFVAIAALATPLALDAVRHSLGV